MPWVITRTDDPTWANALRNFAGVSVCCGGETRAVELYRLMVRRENREAWTIAEIDEPTIRRVLSRQELEKET